MLTSYYNKDIIKYSSSFLEDAKKRKKYYREVTSLMELHGALGLGHIRQISLMDNFNKLLGKYKWNYKS